jgi:bleomycin hydrolase
LPASITLNAQDPDMTDAKVMFHTPVKSQGRDCCCWDFAATSLLESELYRQHGNVYDLSEMWIARHAYYDKAIK